MSSISRAEGQVLEGRFVRLSPLVASDFEALCHAGRDEATFRWYPAAVHGPEAMRGWIDHAIEDASKGLCLPYTIRTQHDGAVVGSTRFGAISRHDRRAEIGWTWLDPVVQRTPVNGECKVLLLKHAFETLGWHRVEFKTDSLNQASRAALLRIGATQEGIFRNHMVTASGRVRHSVYFSIILEEWPRVRAALEEKLAQPFEFRP